MKARDERTAPERALERLAEKGRNMRQVGPGGWLPRNKQPRDAQLRHGPGARKKGGTAGADASRPFGPELACISPSGTGRHVDVRNRREFVMFEVSAASRQPYENSYPTPNLTPVAPPQPDPFTDALAPRAISLGGPGNGTLSTFTISARTARAKRAHRYRSHA